MKKLIIAICAVIVGIIVCTALFVATAVPKDPPAAAYEIWVYPDGSARVNLDNINDLIQTHEDYTVGKWNLKAGTIILPGNGNEIYYEYPRRDNMTLEE